MFKIARSSAMSISGQLDAIHILAPTDSAMYYDQ